MRLVIQGEVSLVKHFLVCNLKGMLLMLPWPPTDHGSRCVPRIDHITRVIAPAVLAPSFIRAIDRTDCGGSQAGWTQTQRVNSQYRCWSCQHVFEGIELAGRSVEAAL